MDDDLEDDLIALNRAIEHMNRATTTREGDTVIRLIRDRPELIRTADELGEYPLHKAAFYDSGSALLWLLGAGAAVDVVSDNRFRQTPLHRAAQQDSVFAIDQLAQAGADLARRDGGGFTPLLTAIYSGRDAAVGALLRLGAPLDLRAAANLRQERVVRLLLRDDPGLVRAEPDAADLAAEAARAGHPGVLRALLEAGADPNAARVYYPPLEAALSRDDRTCVELLLEFGADPDREVKPGAPTARQYAEQEGIAWAVELFDRSR